MLTWGLYRDIPKSKSESTALQKRLPPISQRLCYFTLADLAPVKYVVNDDEAEVQPRKVPLLAACVKPANLSNTAGQTGTFKLGFADFARFARKLKKNVGGPYHKALLISNNMCEDVHEDSALAKTQLFLDECLRECDWVGNSQESL